MAATLAWALAATEWIAATAAVPQADPRMLIWAMLLVIAAPTAAAAWPRRLSIRAVTAGVVITIPFTVFMEQFWHTTPVIAAIGFATLAACAMVDALGAYGNLAPAAAAAALIGSTCAAASVAVIIAAPRPALPEMLAGGVLIGLSCGSTIGLGIALHHAFTTRTANTGRTRTGASTPVP